METLILAIIMSLEFWKQHRKTLSSWAAALCKVLLAQSPSAISEHLFSICKNGDFDISRSILINAAVQEALFTVVYRHLASTSRLSPRTIGRIFDKLHEN